MQRLFTCLAFGSPHGPADVIRLWKNMRQNIPKGKLFVMCDPRKLGELAKALDDFVLRDVTGSRTKESYSRAVRVNHTKHPIYKSMELVMLKGLGIGGDTCLLETFHPTISAKWIPLRRAVFVPLDTVFVGDCDWLFQANGPPIGLVGDAACSGAPGSSVITFTAEGASHLWDEYMKVYGHKKFPYQKSREPSAGELVKAVWRRMGFGLFEKPRKRVLYYERDRVEKMKNVPAYCSLVCFQTRPNFRALAPLNVVRQALFTCRAVMGGL